MKKTNRGRTLFKGKQGNFYDSVVSQKFTFAVLLGFLVVSLFFLFLSFLGRFQMADSSFPPAAISFSLFIILLLLLNLIGFETDGVFENGVTNRSTSLFQFLRGESFQPFAEIDSIGTGTASVGKLIKNTEFLVLYDKTRGQLLRPFLNVDYRDDFFERLRRGLKEKCPQARWVRVRWEDLMRT